MARGMEWSSVTILKKTYTTVTVLKKKHTWNYRHPIQPKGA